MGIKNNNKIIKRGILWLLSDRATPETPIFKEIITKKTETPIYKTNNKRIKKKRSKLIHTKILCQPIYEENSKPIDVTVCSIPYVTIALDVDIILFCFTSIIYRHIKGCQILRPILLGSLGLKEVYDN